MKGDSFYTISVVVLCYGSAKTITKCLDALAKQDLGEMEVIVIDNGKRDKGAEIARAHPLNPKVITNPVNLGCAGGNNLGWTHSKGDYIVFLNPDCYPKASSIRNLVAPLQRDSSAGITGARLLFPNSNRIQHAGGLLHPNGMTENRGYGTTDEGQYNKQWETSFVTGAMIALRRRDLIKLKGFDEDYFPAYYEDTDLCDRMIRMGKKVLYVPSAIAEHEETSQAGNVGNPVRKIIHYARIVYLIKNRSWKQWVREVIPFEISWLIKPYARQERHLVLKAYLYGIRYLLQAPSKNALHYK